MNDRQEIVSVPISERSEDYRIVGRKSCLTLLQEGMRVKKCLVVLAAVLVMGGLAILVRANVTFVNPKFATKVILHYRYNDITKNAVITDRRDVDAIKGLLRGVAITSYISCGFDSDVTVTLTDERRNLVLCPALSGDGYFSVGNTEMCLEVSDAKRKAFDDICGRYGVVLAVR